MDAGAEVIGVSSDSETTHDAWAKKLRLPFQLLTDHGGKVRALYGVPNAMLLIPGRVTFVIDRTGVVRHVFNSLTRATQHVDEALAALRHMT